jgi:hypothetical protein
VESFSQNNAIRSVSMALRCGSWSSYRHNSVNGFKPQRI